MRPVDSLQVWGLEIDGEDLSAEEFDYLAGLSSAAPAVEWVESELDRVWESIGLHNRRRLDPDTVSAYYSHPVWLMNGIFTTVDPESQAHRKAIAAHVAKTQPGWVADFGGGFGELTRRIADLLPSVRLSIVEPFAHATGVRRLSSLSGVSYEAGLSGPYDMLIAQDVLEHVEDPIGLAIEMASATRPGGRLIFANNFYPVVKCHLPRTFYLRHTFPIVMRALGLRYQGRVVGCDHAQVFEVGSTLWPRRVRIAARISRILAPLIHLAARLTPASVRGAVSRKVRGA